jgi:hypothetical protein
MRRIAPLFPPELWNVHNVILCGGSRTNNMCESWNNSFRSLVDCSHPSIWKNIDYLRKYENNVQVVILLDNHAGSRCIVPQHNCSRNLTTSAQVSLMVTNPWKTP